MATGQFPFRYHGLKIGELFGEKGGEMNELVVDNNSTCFYVIY